MKTNSKRSKARVTILATIMLLGAQTALATDGEWSAAASSATPYDWTNTLNWTSGTVAGDAGAVGDVALDITGSSTLTILLRQNCTVGTLQLGDTGSGTDRPASIRNYLDYLTVYESYRLVFDGDGSDAILTAVGSADKSLRGVTLSSRTLLNNEGGNLNFYGIQLAGASGSTTDAHYNLDAINGTGSLVVQSGNVQFFGKDQFNARNTFSGGLTLEGGYAFTACGTGGTAGNPTYGPFGKGRLTLKGGNIGNGQSNGFTLYNKVTAGGSFAFGASNAHITFSPGTASDSFVLDAASPAINLNTTDASKINSIDGVISASATFPAAGVTFTGSAANGTSSKLNLTGASSNTYAGTTTVSSVQLRLNKSATAVAIPGPLVIGGHATKDAQVQLLGASANQIADTSAVLLASRGSVDLNGKSETIGSIGGVGLVTNTSATAATLTVAANAVVAPGTNGVGTLRIHKSALGFGGAATVRLELGQTGDDLIDATGLSFTGLTAGTLEVRSLVAHTVRLIGFSDQISVFTYGTLTAFDPAKWQVVDGGNVWVGVGATLVDNGTGTVYVTGISNAPKPPATAILLR